VTATQLNFRASPSLETLLDTARTNAFELRFRQAELEQQGFKVSLAKNERFSGVTVGPFISEEKAGDTERIVGIGLSLPLPLWNRNTGNIAAAKAREAQAQTSLLLAQRDVERRVTENALVLQAKLEEIGKWRADSTQQFRDAAELADRHYRLGAVPIATYVELQKAISRSHRRHPGNETRSARGRANPGTAHGRDSVGGRDRKRGFQMIARILEFSLRQRAIVLLATTLLIGAGLWSAARLPIDAVPDITNVQVQINTEVSSLAPRRN